MFWHSGVLHRSISMYEFTVLFKTVPFLRHHRDHLFTVRDSQLGDQSEISADFLITVTHDSSMTLKFLESPALKKSNRELRNVQLSLSSTMRKPGHWSQGCCLFPLLYINYFHPKLTTVPFLNCCESGNIKCWLSQSFSSSGGRNIKALCNMLFYLHHPDHPGLSTFSIFSIVEGGNPSFMMWPGALGNSILI